jgi:hypothetical protein
MIIWVGNPERTRQQGLHRHGYEYNKIELKEIE